MGIQLNWEVEADDGWRKVSEDPEVVEARRRRDRRIRRVILIVSVILLAAGGIIAYRLITVGEQIRSALEETVAAETLALRIGNRDAFLSAQSDAEGWQQQQEQTFNQYQSEGKQLEIPGQIIKMDISADRARVTLREIDNGTEYYVIWFYQRDTEGWKHIAPSSGYWGNPKERNTEHVNIEYYSDDQPLVDVLVGLLDSWWETACEHIDCANEIEPIRMKIQPEQMAEPGWADYDPRTLLVPSPLPGRSRIDGAVDLAFRKKLASQIAWRWARDIMGGETSEYPDVKWLERVKAALE
jgi:hypothetical protein